MTEFAAPRFVAHRFGRAYGPDSSRQALRRALEAPVVGVESDCCLTADGRIALLHEPLLEGGTTLSGWAVERTAEEIRQSELLDSDGVPSGEHPLLLEEGLDLLAGRDLVFQLEIKSYADDELVSATLKAVAALLGGHEEWRGRVEIISFWPRCCQEAARGGFDARLIVAGPYTPDALAEWACEAGLLGVILEGAYFSEEPIRIWREASLSVMSGVINSAPQLRRVLPFAPDMVATDRPAELLKEVEDG